MQATSAVDTASTLWCGHHEWRYVLREAVDTCKQRAQWILQTRLRRQLRRNLKEMMSADSSDAVEAESAAEEAPEETPEEAAKLG